MSLKDIPTGNRDEVIPLDAFMMYAVDQIHRDPTVYKDPHKFDASRYLSDSATEWNAHSIMKPETTVHLVYSKTQRVVP
ncbi:hypothetical protein B7494_g4083 [Chlorociboria aeruginascens]|nr:hypothetical protein B7494_g4083 [Chlorociboria aeruginascens]